MVTEINLASTETLNSAKTGLLSKAKSTVEEGTSLNTEDSLDGEGSFMASMLKLSDDSTSVDGALASSIDGNILPVIDNSTENAADSDPLLIIPSLNLPNTNNEKLIQATAAAEKTVTLVGNTTTPDSSESSLLSSSIRQLLQTKTQEQNTVVATGSTSSVNVTAESAVPRQVEIPLINLDNIDLNNQKTLLPVQLPIMSAQQQSSLVDMPSALLQQSGSHHVETSSSVLPAPVNTASNSLSSMSMPTLPQTEVTEPFGRPAWAQGMGKQIVWMANQNITSAEIRLNPAHLGPIEVRIDISDDQVNIALSSRHAIVREAMETAMPKLREMFDNNGMNLADTDVSQQSFAEQREQNTANGQGNIIHNNIDNSDFVNSDQVVMSHMETSSSMVDYYI